MQTAIEGGSFGNALKGALASDAAAAGAFAIGNANQNRAFGSGMPGEIGYVATHGLLGCVAGAAEGTGCEGGAIGAAASAAFTSMIPDPKDSNGNPTSWSPGQVAALAGASTIIGGLAAGLAGQNAQAGALAAQNETLNNRVLHPQEQSLAQQMATAANAKGITNADGSPVTPSDVANQLAQMGFNQEGTAESGAAATVIAAQPPNDGTTWLPAGTDSTTGQTIWAQVPGAANPALQSFIIKTTNGADVPSFAGAYTASPAGAQSNYGPQSISMGSSAGTICPNGNCGLANQSMTNGQVADVSGSISTYLSRASAISTTVAETNAENPVIAVPAATTAILTQTGSWFFGGVQQMLSPNVGQYTTGNLIDFGTKVVTDTNPAFAPIFGEIGELFKAGGAAQSGQNNVNSFWNNAFNNSNK